MAQHIRNVLNRRMIDTAELDRAFLPLFERIEDYVLDGLPPETPCIPRDGSVARNGNHKWQSFFSSWAFSMYWLLENASIETVAEVSMSIGRKFLDEISKHRLHAISPITVLPWHTPDKSRIGYLIRFSILTSGADESERILAGIGPASTRGHIPMFVHGRLPV